MLTRKEHLERCKERALKYLDRGDVSNAITSMLSDLSQHPETKAASEGVLATLGMNVIMNNDQDAARRFIVGFN